MTPDLYISYALLRSEDTVHIFYIFASQLNIFHRMKQAHKLELAN